MIGGKRSVEGLVGVGKMNAGIEIMRFAVYPDVEKRGVRGERMS
jgi:hypothetical protein